MSRYPGLARRLSETASTKRDTLAGGKFTPAVNLAVVSITSPYPADPELRQRLELDTPHELLEVFTASVDIREGDILTYAGVDYPIRSCANWPAGDSRFLRLIVEDLKS